MISQENPIRPINLYWYFIFNVLIKGQDGEFQSEQGNVLYYESDFPITVITRLLNDGISFSINSEAGNPVLEFWLKSGPV